VAERCRVCRITCARSAPASLAAVANPARSEWPEKRFQPSISAAWAASRTKRQIALSDSWALVIRPALLNPTNNGSAASHGRRPGRPARLAALPAVHWLQRQITQQVRRESAGARHSYYRCTSARALMDLTITSAVEIRRVRAAGSTLS
jgi:hypothetical protein